ncbi:MAG TPA: hypothetical protein ENL03_06030 [Phycisphaerae bacterium]|nr:hypothetical protein [Phycisphaerae bacterium]
MRLTEKMAFSEGSLVLTQNGKMFMLDIKTGKCQWAVDIDDDADSASKPTPSGLLPIIDYSQPSVYKGKAYITSNNGLHIIDTKTRQKSWKYPLKNVVTAKCLITGGVLHFGTFEFHGPPFQLARTSIIYAFDLKKSDP